MGEQEKGFRTAMVGGFQRDDVLHYIEDMAREHAAAMEKLEARNAELETELESLREINVEFSQKNASLLERIGELTLDLDTARTALEEREATLASSSDQTRLKDQQYDELRRAHEMLEAELTAVTADNKRLKARATEYDQARDHLAEIEICAHRRAKALEEKAEAEADRRLTEAVEMIDELKDELARTKAEYRETLRRTQQAADEARRQTESIIHRFDETAAALDRTTAGVSVPPAVPVPPAAPDAPKPADKPEEKAAEKRSPLDEVLSTLRGKH